MEPVRCFPDGVPSLLLITAASGWVDCLSSSHFPSHTKNQLPAQLLMVMIILLQPAVSLPFAAACGAVILAIPALLVPVFGWLFLW